MISIAQAAERGIERVRKPNWAHPFDHFKIDIIDGKPGPWLHLYAPFNQICSGHDPVDFIWATGALKTDINAVALEPYTGPLPDLSAYQDAVTTYPKIDP